MMPTAVLLVGGLSTRMGRDKATLELDGEPLWLRQLKLLQKIRPAAVWVSARQKPGWLPSGVDVVLDSPPSQGPLSGITAALARLDGSHLLVLALDLPMMTCEHLAKLVALARPGRGVVPRNRGYWEPLSAIYPKEAAPLALDALASQDVSMHSLVRQLLLKNLLDEHVLSAEEMILYLNANNPEALAGPRPGSSKS